MTSIVQKFSKYTMKVKTKVVEEYFKDDSKGHQRKNNIYKFIY